MTVPLEQRAARLLCVGFAGPSITPELRELIQRGVSAVILFSRNVTEPPALFELTQSIKRLSREPLILCVDQEGGPVRRLRSGFTPIPPLRALGNSGSVELARELGQLLAHELSAVGIDWNLSPVLDVDTNAENPVIGARSLGSDARLVGQLASALAQAMQDAGVAACGKHFPGHGDTTLDSHRALPRIAHDLTRLEQVELVPFVTAVQAGIASILTAHVLFSQLDPRLPATLSRPVLHGLLRERLGYDGLVVSDDLEMAAIVDHFGIAEAVVLGVHAGVDLFLVCHTPERMHQAIDALVRGVKSGRIDSAAFEAAERRTQAFIRRWAAPARGTFDSAALGREAHRRVAERLSSFVLAPETHDPTEPG